MTSARPALLATAALLALAGCGDGRGGGDESKDTPSVPLGFELAMAGVAGAGADDGADSEAPIAQPVIDVSPEELAARMAADNVRLIDVRTAAEVAEGTIPGAEHIPLDQFDPASLDLSDGRAVVLYCRSGRRSAIAGEALAQVTGRPSEHLAGGILAWEAAEQPVTPR